MREPLGGQNVAHEWNNRLLHALPVAIFDLDGLALKRIELREDLHNLGIVSGKLFGAGSRVCVAPQARFEGNLVKHANRPPTRRAICRLGDAQDQAGQ